MTRSQSGRDDEPLRAESLERLVRRIGGFRGQPQAPVHLYVDVSGSAESFLEPLYTAVRGVARLLWRDVHLFSTDLVDVPIGEPLEAACQTTGGTSIAPVARHIREKGVRRAVIVTDGEVGPIGGKDRETLGETILGVALTTGREKGGELAGLARYLVVLAGLERRVPAGRRTERECPPRGLG